MPYMVPESSENESSVFDLEEFFNSFFNLSEEAFIIADKTGKIIKVNPVFTNFSGFDVNELKGKDVTKLFQIRIHENQNWTHIFSKGCLKTESQIIFRNGFKAAGHLTVKPVNGKGFIFKWDKIISDISGLHQEHVYESELKKTIDKFTTLIDNSRDVLYSIYYNTLVFEYLSSSVIELTGYSRDELMRMKPLQMFRIIHPEYRMTYLKYFKGLKSNIHHPNHTIEYKIKTKIGISRWLSDNHKVIDDGNGKLLKLVGNIRDITEFKVVEEALNRSRDRLFKAIEATNDGMWDWRLKNDKIYFDARFYTMLGYDPLEFTPAVSEWMKRIHKDDIEKVRFSLKEHLEGKSDQWLNEYRFLSKNGEWIWILNKGKVFERDKYGKPLRMVGTHSDISLRKNAEEELQKRNLELQTIYEQLQNSEEKFRQLAENTSDVFWLSDEEKIIYVNPAFNKIWGRDRNLLLTDPLIIRQWIHPEDTDSFSSFLNFKAFTRKKYILRKYRIIKPDGEVRWLWSRMFAVLNDKQKIIRIAGITTDITEQKLTEEALITAKEKALESDHLKSAFLANISHEIRIPMNGIIGFAELLKDDNMPGETRNQYINVITKSSEQLLHIIDDIIDISKIEANQLKICKSTFKVSSLLNDLYVFFQKEKVQLGKEKIKLITDVDPFLPDLVITTDESRLRQIFMNLISNALKFTDKGSVKFGYRHRQDHTIEFYVEDTGMGIPADRQSLIFKRFRQLDDTLTRRFGGTGLGLAICEGLVKLLDGKIWVKSEQGKGATFFFTISTGDQPVLNAMTKKDTVGNENYNWQGKTILIVEDDETNQEFLEAVLTPTNAIIITTTTGEDAVTFCQTNDQIDVVLMDIRLPKMNGYEAFEQIRKINPRLPVIAQTAFAMTEDETRCMEFGFSDYISKPINRKHLLSVINNRLSHSKK